MKIKRLLNLLISTILMFTIIIANNATVFAVTGNRTVKSATGSMSIVLSKGQTGNSSEVSFTVSGLPANARVTKIEINTGSLTYAGGMLTNYLTLRSSNSTVADKITWGGQANTKLTANAFKVSLANGTYRISFNSTCFGGPIVNGQLTNIGTKAYKSPSITVYWDDTL